MAETCAVVGVLDNGVDGLGRQARSQLEQAEVVIAASRTLLLFQELIGNAEQLDLTGKISHVPGWIENALAQQKKVVVLATGDPLCHGIASFLIKKLGREKLDIVPNLSSIQLACARFGVSWQDIKICSVHSKDAGEWQAGADFRHGLYPLLQAISEYDKLAVLTSPENNPGRIARMLVTEGMAQTFSMQVAEDLLKASEKLFEDFTVTELAGQSFNGNDVVLLTRHTPKRRQAFFGFSDTAFKQRKPDKGLITKREIRAVSLAKLQLTENSIVWDIGAGSGSVGIEAARISRQGHVYAVEKNTQDFEIAKLNARDFAIHNYTLIQAKAPEGLSDWPDPDAIFIGGSGGELSSLIEYCLLGLKEGGVLVMNFVTLENMAIAIETLKKTEWQWDFVQLQANRSQPILHMYRMQAENPVWIVTVQKEKA